MNNNWLGYGLAVLLLLEPAGALLVQRSQAGGRSYSSGSRSVGGGRSYSSGSRSVGGGRSYSSGSHSSRSSSSFSWPSRSSPSPSRTTPVPRPSPSLPPTVPAPSGQSGRSYSSGTPSSSRLFQPPSPQSGKSYSSSGPSRNMPAPSQRPPAFGGTRPGSPSVAFDRLAAEAQRKAESRRDYLRGQQPKTTYTTPKGESRPIEQSDRRVENLRRQLDHERWVNRQRRQQEAFAPYAGRPVVMYNDPFSSLFWWWLLSQNLHTQAQWAYHHRSDMDDARFRQLVRDNAQLETRIKELEASKLRRDPAWAPEGLDPDLMYSDGYIDAAYNPQPAPAETAPVPSSAPLGPPPLPTGVMPGSSSFRHGLRVLFNALVVLGLLALVIWLVFIKRWGGTDGRVLRRGQRT